MRRGRDVGGRSAVLPGGGERCTAGDCDSEEVRDIQRPQPGGDFLHGEEGSGEAGRPGRSGTRRNYQMKFKERMLRSAAAKGSRVVLALDFSDTYEQRLARAERVLNSAKGGVAAVKVNHHLLLPYGLRGMGS